MDPRESLLMRRHDGELTPDEREELKALLTEDPKAAGFAADLQALAEAHRAAIGAAGDDEDLSDLWDGIAARIGAPRGAEEADGPGIADADALLVMRWHDGEADEAEGERARARAEADEAGRAWAGALLAVRDGIAGPAREAAAAMETLWPGVEAGVRSSGALSEADAQLLMRYADGEAATDEVARAETLLAGSPAASRQYQQVQGVGEAVRQWGAAAGEVDLVAGVMGTLHREATEAARADRAAGERRAPAREPWYLVLRDRLDRWFGTWTVPATAVAAAVVLVLLVRPTPDPEPRGHDLLAAASPFDGAGAARNDLSVEDIESDGAAVMVLESDRAAPAIIWIEEPESAGGRG